MTARPAPWQQWVSLRRLPLQLCLLALCITLVTLGLRVAIDQRPAADAIEAMARGQFDSAAQHYRMEANAGNPDATNRLGNLYLLGLGVDQSVSRAAALYFEAASDAHAGAQLNLGHLYRAGSGVARDPYRAFSWYQFADITGSPWAENYMNHVAAEATLMPVRIEKWFDLDELVAEGL